jgi:hypothetical protein
MVTLSSLSLPSSSSSSSLSSSSSSSSSLLLLLLSSSSSSSSSSIGAEHFKFTDKEFPTNDNSIGDIHLHNKVPPSSSLSSTSSPLLSPSSLSSSSLIRVVLLNGFVYRISMYLKR